MLVILNLLCFKSYKTNFPINLARVPAAPSVNDTVLSLLETYTKVNVTYFELRDVVEGNITEILDGVSNTDKLYVLPAVDVPLPAFPNVTEAVVENISVLIDRIEELPVDAIYIVGQSQQVDIPKSFTNYWVPTIWNSMIAVILFFGLTTCSITCFSNISVQTKFTKLD